MLWHAFWFLLPPHPTLLPSTPFVRPPASLLPASSSIRLACFTTSPCRFTKRQHGAPNLRPIESLNKHIRRSPSPPPILVTPPALPQVRHTKQSTTHARVTSNTHTHTHTLTTSYFKYRVTHITRCESRSTDMHVFNPTPTQLSAYAE